MLHTPFFIMFGRNLRIPLTEMLKPRLRYLGNDETVLSLESLKNMYLLVAESLKKVRERAQSLHLQKVDTILPNQLVTLKVHVRKPSTQNMKVLTGLSNLKEIK